jgi:hypothetical protein
MKLTARAIAGSSTAGHSSTSGRWSLPIAIDDAGVVIGLSPGIPAFQSIYPANRRFWQTTATAKSGPSIRR